MKTINGVDVLTTLEELAAPARTALIVVDMQNEIVSDRGGYAQKAGSDVSPHRVLISQIRRVLDAARAAGVLVTFVEYHHRNWLGASLMDGPNVYMHRFNEWVSSVQEGTWEGQTVGDLGPQADEYVFSKSRGSGFKGTRLADVLRTRGIESLITTGTATGGCVMSTFAEALTLGYYPVLVTDAIGPLNQTAWIRWMTTVGPSCTVDQLLEVWAVGNRRAMAKEGPTAP